MAFCQSRILLLSLASHLQHLLAYPLPSPLSCPQPGHCNLGSPLHPVTLPGLSPGCLPHSITHLGRSGSVEGTWLVSFCCSWRKTPGVHDRGSGAGICSIKRSSRGPRGHHIPAAGTLQRLDGDFSRGPASSSNWNCTQCSTGLPSEPPVYPDTWS